MGELAALAARGMPPTGRGIYARENLIDAMRIGANVIAVNASRSNADDMVRDAGGAWLYSTPGEWTPDNWQTGLQRILQKRRQLLAMGLRVHGIIADPEGGWPALSPRQTLAKGQQLGRALAALSNDMRIGLTSYPLWGAREAVIGEAGDALWYSPQLYGRTSQDPAVIRRWWELWTSLAGEAHCIPSIAGWPASAMHGTPQGFADYLRMLPPSAGFLAWDAAGEMQGHIVEQLRTYEPGGSAVGTGLLGLRNALLRPAALAALVAVIATIVLVIVAMKVWA